MTTAPDNSTVRRALSAHAAIGLIAGALLYLVSLTGTLAVFYEEWQRVEQPRAPEMTAIAPEAVQRGVEAVLATEGKPTTHLYVHLPAEHLPRTVVTTDHRAVFLDASGNIAGPEEIAWSDFLVALHYTLNIPGLIGFVIVGALGVMMLVLALSGVVAHPRIFRDAFRLRARDRNGIGLADWHNRLSVWTLPFTVAIALTGAIIGLAMLSAYGIAQMDHEGDVEAVYAPIFGDEPEADEAPAPAPPTAPAFAYMQTHHPDLKLTYVILHDPLTAGQHMQMVGAHPRRLIFGEYYNFDGDGRFRHAVGMADGDIGQQAAASNYNLHFGNFGGLPVKIAYAVFGLALTVVCATGTYIWLGKRRRRGIEEPRLRASWDAVVWGSPLMLAITFIIRLLVSNEAPLVAIFWLGMAALLAAAIALPAHWRLSRLLGRSLLVASGAVGILALSGCLTAGS